MSSLFIVGGASHGTNLYVRKISIINNLDVIKHVVLKVLIGIESHYLFNYNLLLHVLNSFQSNA